MHIAKRPSACKANAPHALEGSPGAAAPSNVNCGFYRCRSPGRAGSLRPVPAQPTPMARLSILQLDRVLIRPTALFAELARRPPSATDAFFRFALWLALCPPVFAYIGTVSFGWRLGVEPIMLPARTVLAICAAYFVLLLVGLFTTALISRWMSSTYRAVDAFGAHIGLIAIVGAPLALGSLMHLYPQAFYNVLVLVPVLIWSMYLLYRGLPVVLRTSPERGMLMASALIAYLLVAWVSLLCLTVVLWNLGVGPTLGSYWLDE